MILYREHQRASNALNILDTYRLRPIDIESCPISFSNHISKLKILSLDISFHPLHLVDGFLSGVRFELQLLALAQEIKMFCSKLSV